MHRFYHKCTFTISKPVVPSEHILHHQYTCCTTSAPIAPSVHLLHNQCTGCTTSVPVAPSLQQWHHQYHHGVPSRVTPSPIKTDLPPSSTTTLKSTSITGNRTQTIHHTENLFKPPPPHRIITKRHHCKLHLQPVNMKHPSNNHYPISQRHKPDASAKLRHKRNQYEEIKQIIDCRLKSIDKTCSCENLPRAVT